jgi:hypothetical protein
MMGCEVEGVHCSVGVFMNAQCSGGAETLVVVELLLFKQGMLAGCAS